MTWNRWVIGAIAALAIVALLAWARNDPGVGGRQPDPPKATTVVTTAGTLPLQVTTAVAGGSTAPQAT